MLEKTLYYPIEKNYSRNYNLFYEVRIIHRKIDILMIAKKQKSPIIAIEVNMRDWKNAFIPALTNQLVADYVSIAIYYKNFSNIDHDKLKAKGIGLISTSSRSYKIKYKPRKKKIFDVDLRKRIMQEIKEGSYRA